MAFVPQVGGLSLRELLLKQEAETIVRFQSLARGKLARDSVSHLKRTVSAAVKLSSLWRGLSLRKELRWQKDSMLAAVAIRVHWKSLRARRGARVLLRRKADADAAEKASQEAWGRLLAPRPPAAGGAGGRRILRQYTGRLMEGNWVEVAPPAGGGGRGRGRRRSLAYWWNTKTHESRAAPPPWLETRIELNGPVDAHPVDRTLPLQPPAVPLQKGEDPADTRPKPGYHGYKHRPSLLGVLPVPWPASPRLRRQLQELDLSPVAIGPTVRVHSGTTFATPKPSARSGGPPRPLRMMATHLSVPRLFRRSNGANGVLIGFVLGAFRCTCKPGREFAVSAATAGPAGLAMCCAAESGAQAGHTSSTVGKVLASASASPLSARIRAVCAVGDAAAAGALPTRDRLGRWFRVVSETSGFIVVCVYGGFVGHMIK